MESTQFPKDVQARAQRSLLYIVLFLLLVLGVSAIYRGGVHLAELEVESITLAELPSALFLSLLRMTVAYFAALAFSYLVGIAAARTKWGERILIPVLDILQSVPVVGFFPAAVAFFISIVDGHRLGIEIAACFLIFTSQAWNMAFGVYEAIKGIPRDKVEAVISFGVHGSRRFWLLYAPASLPRLIYNSILSWSNGWFFLVACELIAVGPVKYNLPGIGSFLARAANQDQVALIPWGLLALTLLILLMDYLIWRPLSLWSDRFKNDSASTDDKGLEGSTKLFPFQSWDFLSVFTVPALTMIKSLTFPLLWVLREVILPLFWDLPMALLQAVSGWIHRKILASYAYEWRQLKRAWRDYQDPLVVAILGGLIVIVVLYVWKFLAPPYPDFVKGIPMALLVSTGRLIVAMLLSLLWIIPLVIWCWDKPRLRQWLTTVAQIGASLPAIALFPLIILVMVQKFGGGMETASILLLLTGMQWYLLFNCLGGVAVIPSDIAQATRSFGLKGRLLWSRLVLPAIRPAMITGAITAWGGGWNALVVAEYVIYKDQVMSVNGIGSLLNRSVYELGDNKAIVICLAAMVGWILVLNLVFWRPVYQNAIEKCRFE